MNLKPSKRGAPQSTIWSVHGMVHFNRITLEYRRTSLFGELEFCFFQTLQYD